MYMVDNYLALIKSLSKGLVRHHLCSCTNTWVPQPLIGIASGVQENGSSADKGVQTTVEIISSPRGQGKRRSTKEEDGDEEKQGGQAEKGR